MTASDLHPLEIKILETLYHCEKKELTMQEISALSGLEEIQAARNSYWLSTKGLVTLFEEELGFFKLTEEGKKTLSLGLPEKKLLSYISG